MFGIKFKFKYVGVSCVFNFTPGPLVFRGFKLKQGQRAMLMLRGWLLVGPVGRSSHSYNSL